MAAAAFWNCGQVLQFLYYFINSHITWWGCCRIDEECICWVGIEHSDHNSRWRLPQYRISIRCSHFITNKPWFPTKHVVDIKYMPVAKKTANNIVKNYISSKRGVYRPDCTHTLQKGFTRSVHTKLKWIVVVSKEKKTCWPIYQRLIDICIALSDHLIERSNWSVPINWYDAVRVLCRTFKSSEFAHSWWTSLHPSRGTQQCDNINFWLISIAPKLAQ